VVALQSAGLLARNLLRATRGTADDRDVMAGANMPVGQGC
jgi:hypothetical protein